MREGTHTLYLVQHRYRGRDRWTDSALGYMLFGDMTYQQKGSELAAHYRELIKPERDGRRVTGVKGFLNAGDAWNALDAAAEVRPEHDFRVVLRLLVMHTHEVKRGNPS